MRAVADTGEEEVVGAILSISAAAVPQRLPNEEMTDTSLRQPRTGCRPLG